MGRNSGGVTSSGSKGKTAYQKATDALYSAFQVRIRLASRAQQSGSQGLFQSSLTQL